MTSPSTALRDATNTNKISRYLDIYLARLEAGEHQERKTQASFKVDSNIYHAFLETCPHRSASRIIEDFMESYVKSNMKTSGSPQQTITNFILGDNNITVNNVSNEHLAVRSCRDWLQAWTKLSDGEQETIKNHLKKWLEKNPDLSKHPTIQEVLARLSIKEAPSQ